MSRPREIEANELEDSTFLEELLGVLEEEAFSLLDSTSGSLLLEGGLSSGERPELLSSPHAQRPTQNAMASKQLRKTD
jgi:hypothetical protein